MKAKRAPKQRIDKLLVELGFAETTTKAAALVMAGEVIVDDHVVNKPGDLVAADAAIRLRNEIMPYVSRGGIKLRAALDHFALDVRGSEALDIGASTGGFTDCLLQRGATRVCAVDVGHNQLAWKLRQDPRVQSIESFNARTMSRDDLPFLPSVVTCDVSFISQTMILPRIAAVAQPDALVVTLVKPQFEVAKEDVGEGGVVRDPALHEFAVERCRAAARDHGFIVRGIMESPLRGPAGNLELLLVLDLKFPPR